MLDVIEVIWGAGALRGGGAEAERMTGVYLVGWGGGGDRRKRQRDSNMAAKITFAVYMESTYSRMLR